METTKIKVGIKGIASLLMHKFNGEELKKTPRRVSQVAPTIAGAVADDEGIASEEDKIKEFEKHADSGELMELSRADSIIIQEEGLFDQVARLAITTEVELAATNKRDSKKSKAKEEKYAAAAKSESSLSVDAVFDGSKASLSGTYSYISGNEVESYSLEGNGTFYYKMGEGLKQSGNWETNGDTLLLYFRIPDNEQRLAPAYYLMKDNGLYKILVIPEGKIIEYDKFYKRE